MGASHQEKALSGQLVNRLKRHFRVAWRLEAVSGATTTSTLASLSQLDVQEYDVVVTSLGVNDVTSSTRCPGWLRSQHELRVLLNNKFGAKLIIVSGLPPMHEFPGLPQPLRSYLGARATRFDNALETDLAAESTNVFLSLRFPGKPEDMARDGFHPGPTVYREWAIRIADVIIDRLA